MGHRRMGQLLSTIVPITDQDVEEILQEQNLTHRQFGEIAVAWGLCTPANVWEAWARQPHETLLHVDLSKLGVDAQAPEYLPRHAAEHFGAIPVRAFDNLIVIALKDAVHREEIEQELAPSKRMVAFVLAESDKIDHAIATYYAPEPEAT